MKNSRTELPLSTGKEALVSFSQSSALGKEAFILRERQEGAKDAGMIWRAVQHPSMKGRPADGAQAMSKNEIVKSQ
jgi:hypothetical protein